MAASLIAGDDAQLLAGKSISHYQIISLVGKGGMGEVYCARDTKLDRSVALKILPEEMSVDAERMRRFVREAKAASNRKMEPWVSLRELRLASGRSGIWMGLAPDDSTMVLHDLGIQDIYALEWHAP